VNEAFEKYWETGLAKWGTLAPLSHEQAFLAGLAAAQEKCATVSQSFAGSRAAQRGATACADAVKALREGR